MKYREFIREKEKLALANDKEDSSVILLLTHTLNINTARLYTNLDNEITNDEIEKFNTLFNEYLYNNKPIQYLMGYVCFYGYNFIVNENVLIPRFETEELVEQALYRYDRYFKGQKINVADIATGSGCIGISLKLEEPNMNVTLTDISLEALEVAKENSKKLHADVEILQGDMVKPLTKKYDMIISNPPYIPDNEEVMSLVKDNEPNIALFGGNDGLKFYNVILRDISRVINDRAIIGFEHGYNKNNEIEALAKHYFPDCRVEHIKDMEQKDRMTFIYIGDFNE